MLASTEQIVNMFENLGLDISQISDALDLEKGAVEFALVSNSSKYRQSLAVKETGKTDGVSISRTNLFNNDEVNEAARVFIAQLMSEDEHIRQKAAKFIINESKGRHDTVKNLKQVNTQFNVTIVNDQLKRAREAKEAAKSKHITVNV